MITIRKTKNSYPELMTGNRYIIEDDSVLLDTFSPLPDLSLSPKLDLMLKSVVYKVEDNENINWLGQTSTGSKLVQTILVWV